MRKTGANCQSINELFDHGKATKIQRARRGNDNLFYSERGCYFHSFCGESPGHPGCHLKQNFPQNETFSSGKFGTVRFHICDLYPNFPVSFRGVQRMDLW